ncbi:serine/threonine protein kinase [Myxococcota bacterium]|nr:serine/threonine protein kinase [Myxococcota bacterium]
MSGQRLGNYLIEEPLGQGGVATVWRARHRFLGTAHALKVLSRPSPKALTRLLREGRVQAQLQHPAVVPVTDIVVDDERVALAMPLIAGGTLEGWLRQRGPQPAERALALFQPILEAIAHAHAAGVLHRDLKPANVLMDHDQPRVADFGIARLLGDEDDPEITRVGAPMGTLGFCSPEQWANASQVDERSDVFSLAALLYWLLCGRAPFDEASPTNTLRNTLTGQHPDLRRLAPGCPERVAQAVHQALLPRPEDRPASAVALAALLDLPIAAPARHAGPPRLARTEHLGADALSMAGATPSPAPTPLAAAPGAPAAGALALAVDAPSSAPRAHPPPALPPPALPFTPTSQVDATDDEATLGSAPPALLEELAEECRQARRSLPEPAPRATPPIAHGRAWALAGASALGTAALLLALALGRDQATAEPAPPLAPPAEDWTASLADVELPTPAPEVPASPSPGAAALDAPVASPAPVPPRPSAPRATPSPSVAPATPTAVAAGTAPCPREGGAALGWIALSQKGSPAVGERLRIRRPTPVLPVPPGAGADGLTGSPRCQLARGERVEVRTAAVPGAGDLRFVEVFPLAITGG